MSTKIGEFDRVLGGPASPDGNQGGGIVQGSVILVAGDPGIGKSTLLLQLALNLNNSEKLRITQKPEYQNIRKPENLKILTLRPSDLSGSLREASSKTGEASTPSHSESFRSSVLYVAGEESAQQIKIRAERIKEKASLSVLNEVDVDVIVATIEDNKPSLVVIDSIQTMETSELSGVAGSVGQVRESAHRLQKVAKRLHIPIVLVGHVTKEGTVAGPKTLEHLVDVVLSLEGEPTSNFRMLRASKNRFGPTDEVGVFEMEESGLVEVSDPSKFFLETRVEAPGSAVVPTLNGLRPILVEIQALVTKSFLPAPRRTGSGIDNNRLQLLVAVLQKRLGLPLYDQDIFVNVTGGLRVMEPAADLGICMAVISSLKDKLLPPKAVFVGEVGLLGEVRGVRGLEKRAREAKKLGYNKIISPENARSLSDAVKSALF